MAGPDLIVLNLENLEILKTRRTIHFLKISVPGDDSLKTVIDIISQRKDKPTDFDFSSCSITDAGLQYFCQVYSRTNSPIHSLNLTNNQITNTGLKYLAKSMPDLALIPDSNDFKCLRDLNSCLTILLAGNPLGGNSRSEFQKIFQEKCIEAQKELQKETAYQAAQPEISNAAHSCVAVAQGLQPTQTETELPFLPNELWAHIFSLTLPSVVDEPKKITNYVNNIFKAASHNVCFFQKKTNETLTAIDPSSQLTAEEIALKTSSYQP